MDSTTIPFGEFLPDQPDFQNPGLTKAQNVIPTPGGYGPFQGPSATGSTVTGSVAGAAMYFDSDGAAVYVGGTGSALFVRQGGTVSTTAVSALGANEFWRFARFNNFIVAVSPSHAPRYLTDLATDTTWGALGGSPPTARVVGVVGKFLVLGDIGSTRSRAQWSAYNDPTATWAYNKRKQSGLFDFPGAGGNVTAITDADAPILFQERAMWRFPDVGGPATFRRDPLSEAIGCIAPGSVVTRGRLRYFLSQEGFHASDGAGVQDISRQRVFDWFLAEAEPTLIDQTHGAWDVENRCIRWAFKSRFGTGDVFDRQIVYSYSEERWSTAETSVRYLTRAQQDAVTFADIEANAATIDEITNYATWDDPALRAQGNVLGAWTASGSNSALSVYTGDALEADLETGEFQPRPGSRVFVSGLRPELEGAANAAIAVRSNTAGSAVDYGTYTSQGADGFCPMRKDGMYARAAVKIPAASNWAKASGVTARFRVSGRR